MSTHQTAIRVSNLSVAYRTELALKNANFTVQTGSIMGIIGPNGAGKSTLLKAMLGLLTPLTGQVAFFGQPLTRVRQRIGYVPQSTSVDWDYPATVFDVALMGTYGRLGIMRRPSQTERAHTHAALEQVGIADLADRQIGELSGGQRQRAFLARALAASPDLLILDEPFQGVDAVSEASILEVLLALQRDGQSAVVVHHDLTTVQNFCDHVTLLNRDVIASGPIATAFTRRNIEAAYNTVFQHQSSADTGGSETSLA